MRTAEEGREVEDVAEAVDNTEFWVIDRRLDALKVEADVLQQAPREDHQEVVNLRVVDVEYLCDELVVGFELEDVEYHEPEGSESPNVAFPSNDGADEERDESLQVKREEELNVVHDDARRWSNDEVKNWNVLKIIFH